MRGAPTIGRARVATPAAGLRVIAVAAAAAITLAACSPAQGGFGTLAELGDAYASAGGSCTDLVEQFREDEAAPDIASCGTATELTVAADTEQAQQLAVGYMLRGTPVLTDTNWLVVDPDIANLQAELGGRVLQLEASPGPANLADGLLLDSDGVVEREGVAVGQSQEAIDADAALLSVYLDPMCAFCGTFWETNEETIDAAVAEGALELDLHAVALSDSEQNEFSSSFAVNALACVADEEPASVTGYLGALFDEQSEDGWTLETLSSLAEDQGVPEVVDCITAGDYLYWTRQSTQRALTEPLADGEPLRGVPSVLLDDQIFTGDVADPAAFESFLAD